MSTYRAIAFSGIIAVIVAISLIAIALYIPIAGFNFPNQSETVKGLETGDGTLSVLITDPPTVPQNVTAVFISYSDVQAHVATDTNASGWFSLNGSGELDLLGVINASQTIANASLPSGLFNGLRFNVTGITVTYNNQNYTGQMVSSTDTLYIWIPGGITVTSAETTAAMIDLTPTVIMGGTQANPIFVFIPSARGYVMPSTSVPAQSHQIGYRILLGTNTWWISIEQEISFGITGVALAPNSLTINVTNMGISPVELRLVGVTTGVTASGGQGGLFRTSDIFVAQSNGTLDQMTTPLATAGAQVAGSGVTINAGQSITLTYRGNIEIGMQLQLAGFQVTPIMAGNNYQVWVQGSGKVAQAGTTATS